MATIDEVLIRINGVEAKIDAFEISARKSAEANLKWVESTNAIHEKLDLALKPKKFGVRDGLKLAGAVAIAAIAAKAAHSAGKNSGMKSGAKEREALQLELQKKQGEANLGNF